MFISEFFGYSSSKLGQMGGPHNKLQKFQSQSVDKIAKISFNFYLFSITENEKLVVKESKYK